MCNMIAFCGLDCSACPAYTATQANDNEGLKMTAQKWSEELGLNITPDDCICDGCQPRKGARLGGYCNECPIRACNIEHGYENCSQCSDYMCDNLSKFVEKTPEVKTRLDRMRKAVGK